MEDKHKECVYVVGLNVDNSIIYIDLITMGTINACTPITRECVKLAIERNVCSIIVSHNHPNGGRYPSPEDKDFTENMKKACRVLQINFLDHVIYAGENYFSFSDEGLC